MVSEIRRRSIQELQNHQPHQDNFDDNRNGNCLHSIHSSESFPSGKNGNSEEQETKSKSKFTKRQILILIIMAYGDFWLFACDSLVAPFLPQEAEKKNMTPSVYGLVVGSFELVVFVTSPLFGKLMPKYVSPSFLLIAGIFVSATFSVSFGFLEYLPPGTAYASLTFILRISQAVGASAYLSSSYVIVVKEFPENRATVLSFLETMFGLSMIAGPAIGGALYQLGGYILPFVVSGGILFFGAIMTVLIMPSEEKSSFEKQGSLLKLILHFRILVDVLVYLTSFIEMGFNETTLEPHLRKFNLQPVVLGAIFAAFAASYALASPIWGYLCDKVGRPRYLCLIGCGQCILGHLLIGPAPFIPFDTKLWVVILAQILIGSGLGAKLICTFVQSVEDAVAYGFPDDASTYALVTSVFLSVSSLGGFIGPSLGGFLLQHIGYGKGTMVLLGFEIIVTIVISLYCVSDAVKESSRRNDEISLVPEDPEKTRSESE